MLNPKITHDQHKRIVVAFEVALHDAVGELLGKIAANQSFGESGVDAVGGKDEQIVRRKGESAGPQHRLLIPYHAAA